MSERENGVNESNTNNTQNPTPVEDKSNSNPTGNNDASQNNSVNWGSAMGVASNTANSFKTSGKNDEGTAEAMDRNAKMAGKTAVAVGKAAAKASTGDEVGAATTLLGDEGIGKLLKGIIIMLIIVPLVIACCLPNILFTPEEDAYQQNVGSNTVSDIIQADYRFNSSFAGYEGLHLNGDDSRIQQMLDKRMIDKDSLKAIAHNAKEDTDIDAAPVHLQKTMDNMISIVKNRIEQRHSALINTINSDFAVLKNSLNNGSVDAINLHINDPMTNGMTTSDLEAAKLICLYSVQNDGAINNVNFDDFRRWLGEKDKNFFSIIFGDLFDREEEGYDSWRVKPKKWVGNMMTQDLFDKANKEKEAEKRGTGTYDEEDYKEYYTSAIGEMVKLNPEVRIDKQTIEHHHIDKETGHRHTWYTYIYDVTYSFKITNVDTICNDIVKFDDAVPKNAEGKPLYPFSEAAHRQEIYEEMCGSGEGKGLVLDYFGIASSGSIMGLGNGSDIVRVAMQEIGTTERSGNNDVKYNDWYYGRPVSGSAYPWCAAFIAWCANECSLLNTVIPNSAYSGDYVDYFMNRGRAGYVSDSSYDPQPGDLLITNGYTHIGMVEKYENGILYTIEGNSTAGISEVSDNGGCVARHAYGSGYSMTMTQRWGYYCRPEYPITGVAGVGEYITIPHDGRNLGSVESYMGWHMTTSKTAPEGQLKYNSIELGRGKPLNVFGLNNCATIDNRLCIATVSNIGGMFPVAIGDYVDVVFTDGTVWNCVIAETKAQQDVDWDHDPANEWGHYNGKGVVEIIYWDYSSHPQNKYLQVEKIIKVGSYSTGVNDKAYK